MTDGLGREGLRGVVSIAEGAGLRAAGSCALRNYLLQVLHQDSELAARDLLPA